MTGYGDRLASALEELRDRDYRLLLLLLAVSAPLYFFPRYYLVLALSLASVLTAFAVNRAGLGQTGIELATFTTVFAGAGFGPRAGALTGLVLSLLQLSFSGHAGKYILWVVPSYAAAGVLAAVLGVESFLVLGIILTLMLHGVHLFFSVLSMENHVFRYLPYLVFNSVFNFLIFKVAADLGLASLVGV